MPFARSRPLPPALLAVCALLLAAAPAARALTFAEESGSPIGVGANPVAVATGDVNGDGGPDLLVWSFTDQTRIADRQVGTKHFKGLAFTPDGSRLVTVSNDATVRLWDTASWKEVASFSWKIGRLGCVAVSPDGMRMAAGGHTGKVIVWDAD